MLRAWFDKSKQVFLQYRIDRMSSPFPRFRSTLAMLWITGLLGVGYGHVLTPAPQPRTVSLALSVIAFIGAVFIISLKSPFERLKLLAVQIVAILLFFAFVVALYLTYIVLFQTETRVATSVQITWVVACVLLAFTTWRTVGRFFHHLDDMTEKTYPGMLSAPALFLLLLINYVWWWFAR